MVISRVWDVSRKGVKIKPFLGCKFQSKAQMPTDGGKILWM